MKRLTPPIEVCDAFVPKEIPWDVLMKYGLYVGGAVGIVAGIMGAFGAMLAIRFWLMPRSAKQ